MSGGGKKSIHPEILFLILVSAVLLGFGLVMPILTIKQFLVFKIVLDKNTYSVLTGIQALYMEGNRGLAVIVFCFSIIFPILKLFLMFAVWLQQAVKRSSQSFIVSLLGYLGKWSMMDVFVVAFTVVVIKVSHFMDARAQAGIYVFTLSIVFSMLASMRLEHFHGHPRA